MGRNLSGLIPVTLARCRHEDVCLFFRMVLIQSSFLNFLRVRDELLVHLKLNELVCGKSGAFLDANHSHFDNQRRRSMQHFLRYNVPLLELRESRRDVARWFGSAHSCGDLLSAGKQRHQLDKSHIDQ